MDLIGGFAFQRLMRPFFVVQSEPALEGGSGLQGVFELMAIKALVSHGPPKPLDKDIAFEQPSAVHADPNSVAFHGAGELLADKLTALEAKSHRILDRCAGFKGTDGSAELWGFWLRF